MHVRKVNTNVSAEAVVRDVSVTVTVEMERAITSSRPRTVRVMAEENAVVAVLNVLRLHRWLVPREIRNAFVWLPSQHVVISEDQDFTTA